MALKLMLVAVLLLAGSPARASDFQVWNAAATTFTPTKERPTITGWFDLHARRGADSTVLIVRPAIGVTPTRWLVLHQGYAWVPAFSADSTVNEHRSWQQMIFKGTTPTGFALQSRTRFEQRFRAQGNVGFRIRQFARLGWQPNPDSPLGVVVWDELFVQLNDTDWGASSGFDQNRIFAGGFFRTSAHTRLEAGYLRADLDRGGPQQQHVLSVTLFVRGGP
jgi:hypothetical protein